MDRQETRTRSVPRAPLGRVLVVEDDAKLLDLFVRAVEHGGYECGTATSGDQALWSVLSYRPEVIVLDVVIPHPSGIEVCRHLRTRGWIGGVIVVSARATPEDRDVALRAGADTFLAKPFALGDLLAAIEALLPGNAISSPTPFPQP